MTILDPLNTFLDRAEKGDGQFAIAAALWRCSDMLDRIGFTAPDGSPGALEFIGMQLRDLVADAQASWSIDDE